MQSLGIYKIKTKRKLYLFPDFQTGGPIQEELGDKEDLLQINNGLVV